MIYLLDPHSTAMPIVAEQILCRTK